MRCAKQKVIPTPPATAVKVDGVFTLSAFKRWKSLFNTANCEIACASEIFCVAVLYNTCITTGIVIFAVFAAVFNEP